MDRLDAMRAFVQVVDSGGYTPAARVLGAHKATLSLQVQQLEAHLGVRLLTRTTRSVVATAEGLAYRQRVAEILAQVDAAEAWLRAGTASVSGTLRVEVPTALGRLVLMPELPDLLARHPRLNLDLACSDRTVDLVRDGVDCAVRGGALPDSSLVARPLGELPMVLCAAPRHLAAHGVPRQPGDLAAQAWVAYRQAAGTPVRHITLHGAGGPVQVECPARLVTTDSGAVLSGGLAGLGLIQVAEFVARPHLASGALVRVLPDWACPAIPMHLVSTSARHRTARVRVFMDWAQAVVARTVTPGRALAPAG